MRHILVILFLFCFRLMADDEFFSSRFFETYAITGYLTNDVRLGRHDQTMPCIMWPKTKKNSPLVFQHGVWLIGFRDGKLIGTAPMWDVNYTPGPIIDQTAAVIVNPADSARYRTYIVTRAS
ncbi:MAG: hypothetical protein EHM72_05415, partial [Calditrichaeota bacterium]